jgi:threonylcarbamoyladenosine tRNA methylthiotransferase MtaB
MPTLKTITLGCKVNQYETEYLRQGFVRLGYRDAAENERPELCVVNTCAVTAEGEAKCRKIIRRFAQHHPQAGIIVMGCYATRAPEEVAALPGVIEVVADKRLLPDLLARYGLTDVPDGISSFPGRRRAYVKVQDGCRMRCSFCIIPQVRPVLSSRPAGEVLDEIRRLLANGHREIVLTGIHLGHYGRGPVGAEGWPTRSNLAGLLRAIVKLPGSFRVRLSSIEAAEATQELIRVMRDHPRRICPHLHLSMQSGSDSILARMRRRWNSARFIQRCLDIRQALDRPALTTDVIVGFPGETEDDFQATCRVAQEVQFAKIHIFRFSPRQETPAAVMPHQVQDRVKQQRAARLEELGRQMRQDYMKSLLGRRLQVLVESPLEVGCGWMYGTSSRYVPVELPGDKMLINHLVEVVAGTAIGDRIRGVPGAECPAPGAP